VVLHFKIRGSEHVFFFSLDICQTKRRPHHIVIKSQAVCLCDRVCEHCFGTAAAMLRCQPPSLKALGHGSDRGEISENTNKYVRCTKTPLKEPLLAHSWPAMFRKHLMHRPTDHAWVVRAQQQPWKQQGSLNFTSKANLTANSESVRSKANVTRRENSNNRMRTKKKNVPDGS
jgi:hypothetical protein